MKGVIKNQKKMKNTMYIVFGVFALTLFGVTIINPSYASEGLIIDDALDAIVLYGEVETAIDEEIVEESQNIGTTESELVSYEKVVEGDEVSQEVSDDEEDDNEDAMEDENLDSNDAGNREDNQEIGGEKSENESEQPEAQNLETSLTEEVHEVDNNTPENTVEEDKIQDTDNSKTSEYEQSEIGGFVKNSENDILELGDDEKLEIESEEIYGTGEYEGVKVEVYVQTGAFPKGTILSIVPITSDDDIEDIQDVLEEQKNVEKTEKVIAFDITFLDPETQEELQPLTGTVQVIFNYEENEELKAAEESEDQELRVYHLNDKDEEGEKVEEIKDTVVEEVVVNEEKSEEENVMVVEAGSFSIYAIIKSNLSEDITIVYNANGGKFLSGSNFLDEINVIYRKQNGIYKPNINVQAPNRESGNPNVQSGWMFVGWYTTPTNQNTEWLGQVNDTTTNNKTVYAKWLSFNDLVLNLGGKKLILMDRNMGAEGVATGIYYPDGGQEDDSVLGFYYQWGNNYGFKSNGNVNTVRIPSYGRPDITGYGPDNYYSSSSFYTNSAGNYDSWYSGSNSKLWGGGESLQRKKMGPCPMGYHMPGYDEWGNILKMFKTENTNNSEFCAGIETLGECFSRKLKLPYSGVRDKYTGDPIQKGLNASYQSSDKYSNYAGYRLFYSNNLPDYLDHPVNRYASNIRCFKNTDESKLIFLSGGEVIYTSYILNNNPVTESFKPEDPVKDGYNFLGWYKGTENFIFSSSTYITEDTILTAKRSKTSVVSFNANGGSFEDGNGTKNMLLKFVNIPKGSRFQTEMYTIPGVEQLLLDVAIYPVCNNNVVFSGMYNSVNGGIYGSPSGAFVSHRYTIYGDTVYIKVLGGTSSCTANFGGIIYPSVKNPIYEGKDFDGWYTEDGEKWNIGDEIDGDIEVFAHWKDPITIKYDANGGYFETGNTTTIDVVYTRENGIYSSSLGNNSLKMPDRKDYMFAGWYTTQSNQIIEWSGIIDDTTESQTVYAKWLPFNDLDIKDLSGNVLFTIMDRNMGAIEAGTGINSYGYYFQWGNNYGFSNTGTVTTNWKQVDITGKGYGPGNYYSSRTFITRSSSPYRWDIDTSDNTYSDYGNLNLWGGEGDTVSSRGPGTDGDRQGPCPSGYHVPSTLEWKAVRELWCTEKMGLSATCNNGSNLRDDLKLPFAGYRSSNDASVLYQGSYGYYWSSSPIPSKANSSYRLYFYSSVIYPQDYYYRANGYSVRCFKDSQTTKTLTFSVLEQVISRENLKWREPVLSGLAPESPEMNNAEFIGWFEDGNEKAFEFGSNTYLYGDVNLYAKFKCNIGYVETSDGKSCEKIRVDFDANGGEFEEGKKVISRDISIVGIQNLVTEYAHTINLTDEGEYVYQSTSMNPGNNCTYAQGSSGSGNIEIYGYSTGFLQIEGAKSLNVTVKYGGSSYCTPGPIGIRTGEYTDYDPRNPNQSNSAIRYLSDFLTYGTFETSGFVVEGDSIMISQASGCPNYGRYITVSGIGIVKNVEYLENDFDDILQPSREGHDFVGWYLSDNTEFNTGNVSTGEVTKVYAKWECADGYEERGGDCIRESETSNYSGGGGRKTSDTSDSQNHNSAEEKELSGITIKDPENNTQADFLNKSEEGEVIKTRVKNTEIVATVKNTVHLSSSSYTKEQNDAYSFAKSNGLTTTESIEEAKMNTELTRIQMAKMLSNFAINVLGQEPDTEKGMVNFDDVTNNMDKQYDNAVTKAYQLGIMGQNVKNNEFRPNDTVTRAEFASSLSRLLYHTEEGEYKGTGKYYVPHIAKLYNEGIIAMTDPKTKEKRGYVMLMLMRSVEI